LHWSSTVQGSPSLQNVPSLTTGFEQAPVLGSQKPAMWHPSSAVHVIGFGGFEHRPVLTSQIPATWQRSEATQVTAAPPVHTPAVHTSFVVQKLWSLQVEPSGFAWLEH
jgi:hypothetical protein